MPHWITLPEIIKVVTILIVFIGWGLNQESRITIAENNIEQETAGYRAIQNEFSRRLQRLEDRMEKRLDRIERKIDNINAS